MRVVAPLVLSLIVYAFNCSESDSIYKDTEYKIAYNVLYDGYADNYEIFVMNPDGTGQTNISNSPGVDWVYHAYGDRLYFISDRDSTSRKYFLYEMKWDGSEVRRVTNFLVHDSWISSRKDGSELVVVPNFGDDNRRDLYIIDLEGNILSQVTNDTLLNNDAAFSPDGNRIAFRSYRSKVDELYVVELEDSSIRRLTFYPEDDSTAMDWEYHAGPPTWRDLNTISYLSKQNNNYSIFQVNVNTGQVEQITPDTTSEGYPSNEGWHSWSRDGSKLAFNATNWKGNYDIYLMNADGSGLIRLTEDEWYEQAPVFVYPE